MKKKTVDAILDRALQGYNISSAEALVLLQQREPDARASIQITADLLRRRQSGDTVTYVINRNINFTNICEQHCSFCAFRRDDGDEGAFWLDAAQIQEKATDAVQRGATEICMQGGLNLQAKLNGASLPYYLQLVKTIKDKFPQLHLHAFSPQEIEFIAREDNLSFSFAGCGSRFDAGNCGGSSRRCCATGDLPGKTQFGNLAGNCGNCSQSGFADNEYDALRAY